MTKKANGTGPVFLRFVPPIVSILRDAGGYGHAAVVTDQVVTRLGISEAEQQETTTNGQSRVRNQIAWARFYLSKAGYLESPERGVWALTEAGRNAGPLDAAAVTSMFARVQGGFKQVANPVTTVAVATEGPPPDSQEAVDHRTRLLEVLRGLPPAGFERICKRLLLQNGFERVEVTGKSGDGGIDGWGVLAVNPLVSFKVLFQCKRYGASSPVTPSQVRDFRGAMQGRADKGLILTTGNFTTAAVAEANRDGAPPVQLVDGLGLVEMFERAGVDMGLRPVTAFELVDSFFDEFRR